MTAAQPQTQIAQSRVGKRPLPLPAGVELKVKDVRFMPGEHDASLDSGKAFQEFLQALFVARRTYPLAYNKWIREQVTEWLSLPRLYEELPPILSVRNIESPELGEKADASRTLLERWTCPEPHSHETVQPSAASYGFVVSSISLP